MLKLNGLMMGLNIKKVSSLIRLEGEVRKDGQANGGAYPIIQFNIIYIMRTSAQEDGSWRSAAVTGLVISLRLSRLCSIITGAVVSNYAKRIAALIPHQYRATNCLQCHRTDKFLSNAMAHHLTCLLLLNESGFPEPVRISGLLAAASNKNF